MFKKLLFINPIVYTTIIVGITFGIQFFGGARLAYFVVDVVDSGLEEVCRFGCLGSEMTNYPEDCYFYGGCLNMVDGKNIVYMSDIMLGLIFFYTILIPFVSGKRGLYMLIGLVGSYLIYMSMKGLDWFYNCHDFCGFEDIFIYPPILIVIFVFFVLLNKFWIKKSLS